MAEPPPPGGDGGAHAPAGGDEAQESVDLRDGWRAFAQRHGGEFRESEREGFERFSPAFVWRPTIRIPLRGGTLRIDAVRRALLGSWRKERASLRDWFAPGGASSFDYTTTLRVRYRPSRAFELALAPGGETREPSSLERLRHNVEVGRPIAIEAPGLDVHASDAPLARALLSPELLAEFGRLAQAGAVFELSVVPTRRWLGLRRDGLAELRLRLGGLLVHEEELEDYQTMLREVWEALWRAGGIRENPQRGPLR